MQNYVYLVNHTQILDSNAIFYTISDAKEFIANKMLVFNEGIDENDPYYCKEAQFIIYKINIGQCFEAEVYSDGLEKVEKVE